ncbi:MAG: DMT family transporter [Candidatus Nanopelagicales bacterium]|nr:DMT family transporter [Candidatus Nanopelagicales bacterium]
MSAGDARVRIGLSWAFLGVVLFSFSVPLTKVAVGGFDPVFTATSRAVIAAAIAIVFLSIRRIPIPPRHLWKPILITMLGAVFGWPILLAIALQSTTSAHTAVIAAFMPMTTAIFAVMFTHERVSKSFWVAVAVGTAALVAFSLSRGGLEGGSIYADLLIIGAVISSSLCYVQGAAVTRVMPGWQVISWVVVFSLPVTLPATVILWWVTKDSYVTTPVEWGALLLLGISSMYFGFFAWYRGLALAGVAHGGQVQQLQALLTLLWSALFLGEGWGTVAAALVVVIAVGWAQRSRTPSFVAPEE